MIKLYNTWTRKKDVFKPLRKGKVGIYACGPTVYDYAHLGNLRRYIFEDILRRMFEFNGYKVNEVMNITDVGHLTSDEDTGEDKIEVGAKREKMTAYDLAEKYTEAFKRDLERLNIQEPVIWAKATDHIKEQIIFIRLLEVKGFTYKTEDGIYFDTSKIKGYGQLARLKLSGQIAGARIGEVKGKKRAHDFALWKFSYPQGRSYDSAQDDVAGQRQMEWESPWGTGFPGWHIECSAMSQQYLGEVFDIHTGGVDHIPVHHTNEIAQSIAVTGKIPARYWLHCEFLQMGPGKMAKSEGNFIILDDLIKKGYDPLAFRYLVLQAHYRTKMEFSWKALEGAQRALDKIRANKRMVKYDGDKWNDLVSEITAVLNDDLDTPKALAILNRAHLPSLWKHFEPVLALDIDREEKVEIPKEVKELVGEREKERKIGDWTEADKIRDEITKLGYIIEDTEKGPIVKQK